MLGRTVGTIAKVGRNVSCITQDVGEDGDVGGGEAVVLAGFVGPARLGGDLGGGAVGFGEGGGVAVVG